MSFPTMIIRGPSAILFLALFMTALFGSMKLDGKFDFKYSNTVVFLPMHALYVAIWVFIITVTKKQARQATQDEFGQLENMEDDEEMLDETEINQITVVNTSIAHMAMVTWPSFIFVNLKLEFDSGGSWAWGWVFSPFLLFCFFMFVEGVRMGIWMWTDERRALRENQL